MARASEKKTSGRKSAAKKSARKKAAKKPARGAAGKAASKRGPREPRGPKRPASVAARRAGLVAIALAFIAGLWSAGWLLELDRIVVSRFEGRRFSVPSRVYAAPLVIYPGADWQRLDLAG